MSVLLVTCVTMRDDAASNIARMIADTFHWARLSDSAFAVDTNLSPQAVYGLLAPLLDDEDDMLVVTLMAPWAGQLPPDVVEWLRERL